MINKTIGAPRNTRDMVYSECAARRDIQKKLESLFVARGYDEIITPTVEYYDLFSMSGNPVTQEELIKFSGPDNKLWALRPDVTTSIARAAATRLSGFPLPLRFYYVQDVFHAGVQGEGPQVTQAGIELIGRSGAAADIEVIAVAMEAMGRVSGDFRLELGNAAFFKSLLSRLDAGEEYREQLRALIEKKNFAAMGDFLEPYRKNPVYMALSRLPRLFGGEEVLDEAITLSKDVREAAGEIEYLRRLYRELEKAGFGGKITIDLGLLHHIDYYTGVVFRGYTQGAGAAVLRGGRYDGLCGLLGRDLPSTGFALDMDWMGAARKSGSRPSRTLIYVRPGSLKKALELMDAHPGEYELSGSESEEETAAQARERGVDYVTVGGEEE